MQTWHRWRWRRRAPTRRRQRLPFFGGLIGVGLAIALIVSLEFHLRPVLEAMATAKVSNAVTQTLDGAITEEIVGSGLLYSDLVTMERDSTGRVTALSSNMAELNNLRSGILGTVVAAVDTMDRAQLAIPIGNLTGVNFFTGRGIELPVEVVAVGAAHAEFQNQFSDAGINQTRHQINLEVTVAVNILLAGSSLPMDVSAQVPVAETVIVGTVPGTYLQLGT